MIQKIDNRTCTTSPASKENNRRIKDKQLMHVQMAAMIAPCIVPIAQISCVMVTAFSKSRYDKITNKLLKFQDASNNSIIKFFKSLHPLKPRLRIKEINPKTFKHMASSSDNISGLAKNKHEISGAHPFSSFLDSFFKYELKEKIEKISISPKNINPSDGSYIKDGEVVVSYIEDGIKKTFNMNIGDGLTKKQQNFLASKLKQTDKSKNPIPGAAEFKAFYLDKETAVARSYGLDEFYNQLFIRTEPTGKICSIKKDPLIEGVYDVKYRGLKAKKSKTKTIFIDKDLNDEQIVQLQQLAPNNTIKNISQKSQYSPEKIAQLAQEAFEQGRIITNKSIKKGKVKTQEIIYGSKEGILFAGYFKKDKLGNIIIESFFPITHNSEFQEIAVRNLTKEKLDIRDIPIIMGLSDKIKKSQYIKLFIDKFLKTFAITGSIATVFQAMKRTGEKKLERDSQATKF